MIDQTLYGYWWLLMNSEGNLKDKKKKENLIKESNNMEKNNGKRAGV